MSNIVDDDVTLDGKNFADTKLTQLYDPIMLHMNPLFQVGSTRALEVEDVGKLEDDMTTAESTKRFKNSWARQAEKPNKDKRSLLTAMVEADGWKSSIIATLLYTLFLISRYIIPEIINRVISHVSGENVQDQTTLWLLVVGILVAPLLGAILRQHCQVILLKQKARWEVGLVGTVFDHATRLSPVARSENGGSVEVLFQSDIVSLSNVFIMFIPLLFAPLELGVAFYLAYRVIGVSVFFTLILLAGLLPIVSVLGALLGYCFGKKRDNTKERVLMMKELINGIRVVKYYAWESSFQELLEGIRAIDMYWILRIYYTFISFNFAVEAYFAAIPVFAFYIYVQQGNTITYATQFTALAIFALMNQPVRYLANSVQAVSQLVVNISRVRTFLDEASYEPYVSVSKEGLRMVNGTDDDLAVYIGDGAGDSTESTEGASFAWTTPDAKARAKEKEEAQRKKMEEVTNKGKGKGEGEVIGKKESAYDESEIEMLVTADVDVDTTIADNDDKDKDAGDESEVETDKELLTLRDIRIRIPKGALAAVVGPVGCGKSSLLSAMLDDMLHLKGHIAMAGSVAYHQQNPWILNATIKDNILFGSTKEYDDALFQRVIEQSALGPDLASLSAGLQTEIGEKGINLSGGQKARISFARCLYSQSDILLLDDPLSAVDANVCDTMFNKAIKGYLTRNNKSSRDDDNKEKEEEEPKKTVVLVTHQIQLLSKCDLVIVMSKDGTVRACCPFDELTAYGIDMSSLEEMAREVVDEENENDVDDDGEMGEDIAAERVSAGERASQRSRSGSYGNSGGPSLTTLMSISDDVNDDAPSPGRARSTSRTRAVSRARTRTRGKTTSTSKSGKDREVELEKEGKLLEEEDRVRGIVGGGVWVYFANKGGAHWYLYMVILLVVSKIVQAYSEFWLSDWGAASLAAEQDGDEFGVSRQVYYLRIFAAFTFGSVILQTAQFGMTTVHAYNSSSFFFNSMLSRILRAPIGYFDITPSGRIINRFTGDINTADMGTSAMIGFLLNFVIQTVSSCGVIIFVTNGTLALLIVPIAFVYYRIQLYFRKTNTEIKRLASISRTPIYTEISQSLSGVTSLRAFGQVDAFQRRLAMRTDVTAAVEYVMGKCSSWLDLRLNMIGAIISFFVVALAVISPGFVKPSYVAVALNSSLFIPLLLQAIVTQLAMIETMLASVERLRHFSEALPIEDPTLDEMLAEVSKEEEDGNGRERATTAENVALVETQAKEREDIKKSYRREEPPANWPSEGRIEFNDVHMAYRDGPLVLKGVTTTIEPQQKVGICGRTGSGKSSMLVALFRVEKLHSGSIFIDGIDISTVPVNTLRSRLAIIPQDPVMFSASLRYNVDPFNKYSDSEIWAALERVSLKEDVQRMPGGLNSPITEGGSNLSVGQRQLICFTRALLRKPKIVVLDEATAAVDNDTDNHIQTMIREVLKDCTVLTIAHRLNTIVDSDALIVLEQGVLGESGTPEELKNKTNGIFNEMWMNFEQAHS